MQISVPQAERARYDRKDQNFLSLYKTSRLHVSITDVVTAVMVSNTQMFCSRGGASEVLVVSSNMRRRMLNAERINAIEQQSISNAVAKFLLDASFNNRGLQSSATIFSNAATKS